MIINPLVIFVTILLTAFFGFSWVMLAGNWLGVGAFSQEKFIVGELLPLAYGGAVLSVIFATAIIGAKLHYR